MSPEGKEIVLNIINPGEIFGEIAMLDGEERTADAIAMKDCELLVLNRRDFMPILENHADMCMMLLRILCQRLRQTSEQVEDVLFRHLESRIAKALLHLAESAGRTRSRARPSNCMSRSGSSATSPAAAAKASTSICNAGTRRRLIELGKGTIVIREMAALERMV